MLLPFLLSRLPRMDVIASARPDVYVANSRHVAERIRKSGATTYMEVVSTSPADALGLRPGGALAEVLGVHLHDAARDRRERESAASA